jgi:hypothetical protein
MLLGAGGFATGLLDDPGPGVALPGVHGLPATVAEVPVPVVVPVPAVVEVVPAVLEVDPMPLLVEELVLVEGVPVAVVPPVEFAGVHGPGATVVETPLWFCVVP